MQEELFKLLNESYKRVQEARASGPANQALADMLLTLGEMLYTQWQDRQK